MTGDKVWLRDNLVKALGWDAIVAEEVVEAISAAQGQQERDDLVQVSHICSLSFKIHHAGSRLEMVEVYLPQDIAELRPSKLNFMQDFSTCSCDRGTSVVGPKSRHWLRNLCAVLSRAAYQEGQQM